MKIKSKNNILPASFRPLLWGLKWNDLNSVDDKEDIIVRTVNEGTVSQWRWIMERYGKRTIRSILRHRLISELHPESRNLAHVVFDVNINQYARTGTRTKSKKIR